MAETDYLTQKLQETWVAGASFPVYANVYVGLLGADPTTSGSFASELSGAGYGRKYVGFESYPFSNTNEILWAAEGAWDAFSYVFLADSSQGGNMLAYNSITEVSGVDIGYIVRIQVSNLTVT